MENILEEDLINKSWALALKEMMLNIWHGFIHGIMIALTSILCITAIDNAFIFLTYGFIWYGIIEILFAIAFAYLSYYSINKFIEKQW